MNLKIKFINNKMEQYKKLKEEFNTSSFLIDLIEEYKKHCKIFLNIFNEGIINKYLYKKALYFYSFCLKHKKYFLNKDYLDEDLLKNILKINYNFKYLMDIRHSIIYLYYYNIYIKSKLAGNLDLKTNS